MSKTNDHKTVFKKLLSEYCPSPYYIRCPPGIFPRTEYDFKQINVDNVPYEKYLLTINCYDKTNTEYIDECIDNFIDNIGKATYYTDNFYYQFYYCNDRQKIPEQDKTIYREMLTVEVRIYKRSD